MLVSHLSASDCGYNKCTREQRIYFSTVDFHSTTSDPKYSLVCREVSIAKVKIDSIESNSDPITRRYSKHPRNCMLAKAAEPIKATDVREIYENGVFPAYIRPSRRPEILSSWSVQSSPNRSHELFRQILELISGTGNESIEETRIRLDNIQRTKSNLALALFEVMYGCIVYPRNT